jgi:hypothetical protein
MKVGGASELAASQMCEYLGRYIDEHPVVRLDQLCYSVNKVVEDHAYGRLIHFSTIEQLRRTLEQTSFSIPRKRSAKQKIVLLIGEALSLTAISKGESSGREQLVLQYCAIKLLMDAGFAPDKIIASGKGKLIAQLLYEKITMEKAIDEIHRVAHQREEFDEPRFVQWLSSLDAGMDHLLIVIGGQDAMTIRLREWIGASRNSNVRVLFPDNTNDIFFEIIEEYYNLGNEWNFDLLFPRQRFLNDLDVPIFNRKRFWPEVKTKFSMH